MKDTHRSLTMWGMSWRNLYRQPLRTVLTALGVSVGVVAIVAFGTMVRGFWASTNAAIHFGEGDMMVFQAGAAADLLSTLDEEKTRAALLADPDVVKAAPTLWHILPVPKMRFGFIIGLHIDEMASHGEHMLAGRNPEKDDELLIGKVVARTLDKSVGDEILLARERFQITGVFETDVVYFNGAIVMPMSHLQKLAGKEGKVSSFQVKVRPGVDPAVVGRRIEGACPDLCTIASAAQYKKVDEGLEIANAMVTTVSFLAIVIGSVIVTNTMWMAVHERTREIGVLRAVGWARHRIVAMIIIESAGVGLIACVVGCLLGVGLAKISARLPVAAQFVDPVFDWRPFATALAVAVVLSVLGGALPAWRAARISPVEALRYE
ncbi:MAG: ABC transporter permease [Phycisphaerae bacterium]|nr:ABC transporter permease [Phycisphaerae bacterium]